MNLPTQLTCARLGLTGLFVVVVSLDFTGQSSLALAIFVVASITDWLDGYLARRWHMVTDLGKLLDPLADKILVTAALFYASYYNEAPIWMSMLMVAREFLITGLRTLAASKGEIMAAERLGKHKTASQLTAIITMLVCHTLDDISSFSGIDLMDFAPFAFIDDTVIWLFSWATVITLYSGAAYLFKNRHLIESRKPPVIHPHERGPVPPVISPEETPSAPLVPEADKAPAETSDGPAPAKPDEAGAPEKLP